MQHRGRHLAAVIAVSVATISCGDAVVDRHLLQELQGVQRKIIGLVASEDVSVNLTNGRFLSIDLPSSALNDQRADERRREALAIATAGYDALPSRARVDVVTVTLSLRRTYVRFITFSRTTEKYWFRAADLEAQHPASESWTPAVVSRDLYFVGIGELPAGLIEDLGAHFEKSLGIRISTLAPLMVDRVTVDYDRSQLVAEELIAAVRRRYPALARDERARIIAVTAYDIYIRSKRWQFAFSLRNGDDRLAVVSCARMNPAYFGGAPNPDQLRARLRKMMMKNIAIMYYGLPQSDNPRSVLFNDIGGVDELDRMSEFVAPR